MSDRLTFSDAPSHPGWTDLAVPAALILVAVFSQMFFPLFPEPGPLVPKTGDWALSMASSAAAVLFALQCGAVLRGMLPSKAPGTHRALTAMTGILLASIPVSLIPLDLLAAWTLALAGWNFYRNVHLFSFPPAMFSGVCTGAAFVLSPATAGVAAGLLLLQLISLNSSTGEPTLRRSLFWLTGLLLGLLPFLFTTAPLPTFSVEDVHLLSGLDSLMDSITGMGWIPLPFLILGTGVALFQDRITFLGLLLPMVGGIALSGVMSGSSDSAGFCALPVSILCGYGMFRVVRGVEQGMRNAGSPKATAVVPTAILLGLTGYAAWLVTLFL